MFSFDEKIMNFDVANGCDAFIELFTMEDIDSMINILGGCWGHTLTLLSVEDGYREIGKSCSIEEMKQAVLADYVMNWLFEYMNDCIHNGTRHLFDIWEMVA